MVELIRNCSRTRKPVVETRDKLDKADVDFSVALLTSSEQHAVRIEDSKVFARSVALAVAHDRARSSQTSRRIPARYQQQKMTAANGCRRCCVCEGLQKKKKE